MWLHYYCFDFYNYTVPSVPTVRPLHPHPFTVIISRSSCITSCAELIALTSQWSLFLCLIRKKLRKVCNHIYILWPSSALNSYDNTHFKVSKERRGFLYFTITWHGGKYSASTFCGNEVIIIMEKAKYSFMLY